MEQMGYVIDLSLLVFRVNVCQLEMGSISSTAADTVGLHQASWEMAETFMVLLQLMVQGKENRLLRLC